MNTDVEDALRATFRLAAAATPAALAPGTAAGIARRSRRRTHRLQLAAAAASIVALAATAVPLVFLGGGGAPAGAVTPAPLPPPVFAVADPAPRVVATLSGVRITRVPAGMGVQVSEVDQPWTGYTESDAQIGGVGNGAPGMQLTVRRGPGAARTVTAAGPGRITVTTVRGHRALLAGNPLQKQEEFDYDLRWQEGPQLSFEIQSFDAATAADLRVVASGLAVPGAAR